MKTDRQKIKALMEWTITKFPDIRNSGYVELGDKTMVYFVGWEYFNLTLDGLEFGYRFDGVEVDGFKENLSEINIDKFIRAFKQNAGKASAKKLKAEKLEHISSLKRQLAEATTPPKQEVDTNE